MEVFLQVYHVQCLAQLSYVTQVKLRKLLLHDENKTSRNRKHRRFHPSLYTITSASSLSHGPSPHAATTSTVRSSFTLMNEQWQAAKDVLVIVVRDGVAVVTPRLKIHGIYSTTLSA